MFIAAPLQKYEHPASLAMLMGNRQEIGEALRRPGLAARKDELLPHAVGRLLSALATTTLEDQNTRYRLGCVQLDLCTANSHIGWLRSGWRSTPCLDVTARSDGFCHAHAAMRQSLQCPIILQSDTQGVHVFRTAGAAASAG